MKDKLRYPVIVSKKEDGSIDLHLAHLPFIKTTVCSTVEYGIGVLENMLLCKVTDDMMHDYPVPDTTVLADIKSTHTLVLSMFDTLRIHAYNLILERKGSLGAYAKATQQPLESVQAVLLPQPDLPFMTNCDFDAIATIYEELNCDLRVNAQDRAWSLPI